MAKNKKLALKLEIQTYQILTNDEVCIPSLSSILLAVNNFYFVSKFSLNLKLMLQPSLNLIFRVSVIGVSSGFIGFN